MHGVVTLLLLYELFNTLPRMQTSIYYRATETNVLAPNVRRIMLISMFSSVGYRRRSDRLGCSLVVLSTSAWLDLNSGIKLFPVLQMNDKAPIEFLNSSEILL